MSAATTTTDRMAARAPGGHDPKRGRWIPWVFVGGMLLVVAVNGVMVWAALTTFTGVTVGQAYDRGRAYNHVLAEAARQDSLGWAAQVALEGDRLVLSVRDREGAPVAGRVQGTLLRPLERTQLPLDFLPVAPGRWAAEVAPPQPGQWEARLRLLGPGGDVLDIRERVYAR